MNARLLDWWNELVARRGALELMLDLWLGSVIVALLVGMALGWLARPV